MKYCNIDTCDLANGEGVRVSLFVSGCQFHCPGCFNHEAQDYDFGIEYTEKTFDLIAQALNRDEIDGLSILGGDPLWQDICGMDNLVKLCQYAHSIDKTVWIWTGFTWEDIFCGREGQVSFDDIYRQKLLLSCDVLVDGRFDYHKKDLSLAWRGSSNQRVIDIKRTREEGKVILYESKGNA